MRNTESHSPGQISWADLQSTDPAAARAFYGALLGWDFRIAGAEFGAYATATREGRATAGIGGPMPGGPARSVWTIYFASANAVEDVARLARAGAQVVAPAMPVGDFGHLAVLADPDGAVFGLWQPGTHAGFGAVDAPGSFCWAEVNSRQAESNAVFYGAAFGHEVAPVEGMAYWTLNRGGRMQAGVLQMDAAWGELPPHWMVYFAVDDADAAAAQVRALGGTVHHGPFDTPYGRIAVVSDPQGGTFSLMQPSALALES